jgi:hypothetical protein
MHPNFQIFSLSSCYLEYIQRLMQPSQRGVSDRCLKLKVGISLDNTTPEAI